MVGSHLFLLGLPLLACIAISLAEKPAYSYSTYTLGRLDHFLKKPSNEILVAGRPTSRQVAGIAESGFQSFVSISEFVSDDTSFNGVQGDFPSSAAEMQIIESYGLKYTLLPVSFNASSARLFSSLMVNISKPSFVHCYTGFTATVFTTLHLFLVGKILADGIVDHGQNLGFNFLSSASAVALINEVAGLNLLYSPIPTLELPLYDQENSYKSYYWTHRFGNDSWYNVGQVLESHVDAIVSAGYKYVISLRSNGEPTTRLSSDPTSGPVSNEEFSDENGLYSVLREQSAFTSVGLKFYNLPVDSSTAWTNSDNFYNVFVPVMDSLSGPVLLHCASGYRSSAYLATYLSMRRSSCSAWALEQASYVGFAFNESAADESVVSFMKLVLNC